MQHVLQQVSIIATNVYNAGKSCDGGFSNEVLALVRESAITPLRKKKADQAPKIRSKTGNMQKAPALPPETPPRRSLRQKPMQKQAVVEEPTSSTPISTTMLTKSPSVTPSTQGNDWKTTWTTIASNLSPSTKKIATRHTLAATSLLSPRCSGRAGNGRAGHTQPRSDGARRSCHLHNQSCCARDA